MANGAWLNAPPKYATGVDNKPTLVGLPFVRGTAVSIIQLSVYIHAGLMFHLLTLACAVQAANQINFVFKLINYFSYFSRARIEIKTIKIFCVENKVHILAGLIWFQFRQDKWTSTAFEMTTHRPQRLPIVDFAPKDIGDPNQAFGLEIGPVCFS